MNGQVEPEPQADVVFVIEATSMNGTYVNELKTSYIHPILEYFNQNPIIENGNPKEATCESRNCLYTIILYHSTDIRPKPCCRTFAQEKDPHLILSAIDKIKLIGGKSQSNANIVEGLATCLQFFDDLKKSRDSSLKYCILVCSSPPYLINVMENEKYAGIGLDQLASLFCEKKILISILSPRKIPVLVKLFEKTGGDLSHATSKNYSKNSRHLVLLNGLSLKERALSPSTVASTHNTLSVASPKSNAGSIGSPTPANTFRSSTNPSTPGQVTHQVPNVEMGAQKQKQGAQQTPTQQSQQQQSQQTQQQSSQPSQTPQSQQSQQPSPAQQQQQQQQQQPQPSPAQQQQSQPPHQPQPPSQASIIQQQQPIQTSQMLPQQNQFNPNSRPMVGMAPGFFPRAPPQQTNRWAIVPPQQRSFSGTPQSALIAQLQQPPSSMSPQFPQRFDGSPVNQHNVAMVGQTQNTQMHQQFQHPMQQQIQSQRPQQLHMVQPNNVMGQQRPQAQVSPLVQSSITQSDNTFVWQGILEWTEKARPTDITRSLQCVVTTNQTHKDDEPILKTDGWPKKLNMQLLPKQLFITVGGNYLKQSTSVSFHPSPCEALDALTKTMTAGFAGCVQFNSMSTPHEIKVLVLLYTPEKKVLVGFIPNDQTGFVDRLRKLIQAKKASTLQRPMGNQNQPNPAPQSTMMAGNVQHFPNQMLLQQGINNPMGGQQSHLGGMMVGDMQHGGVGQANSMIQGPNTQQTMMHQAPNPVNIQQNTMGIRNNTALLDQRAQIDAVTRQQNLVRMQQLKQNLEAAQQMEMQYQKQLQQPQYGRHQMVNLQQQASQSQQPPQAVRNHPNSVQNAAQSAPQFDDVSTYDF